MFEIFSKTQRKFRKKWVILQKGYFVWRKDIFFERVRLKTAK